MPLKEKELGLIINSGYRYINIKGRKYAEHILAWAYITGEWPLLDIDHKNNIKDDNRFANDSLNGANRFKPKNNTSGLKGVKWKKKNKKWEVAIRKEGKDHYLGLYDCPAVGHFSYVIAANKLFGEFARS